MTQANTHREALSALMDDEASELDIARLLKSIDDPALRADWVRQQQIRDALRGESLATPAIDVSAGVRAALEAKPAKGRHPLVGLAVAASVTMAVVFGGQQYLGSQAPTPLGQLPGGVVSVQGASAMQASYGLSRSEPPSLQTPVTRVRLAPPTSSDLSPYDHLARERYEQLILNHATTSASLQPNALVPYARVPESNH